MGVAFELGDDGVEVESDKFVYILGMLLVLVQGTEQFQLLTYFLDVEDEIL